MAHARPATSAVAASGLGLDDPRTTLARRDLVARKGLLRRLYEEWYRRLAADLPRTPPGRVLELGAGAGFLQRFVPGLVRSEVFCCEGLDLAADAAALPFGDGALAAIAMTNVLHHLPQPRRFFAEASRCLHSGGVLTMIEPWRTPFAEWIYRRLHHEPFDPQAERWEHAGGGPLSGANGALPWILFARDRERFAAEFPALRLARCEPLMPLVYLLSGGMSAPSLAPGWLYRPLRALERATGLERRAALFAQLTLRRA